MQSIGGGRTSSQQRQFQEPSQPQHSRTNKLYFQGPSCVAAPENTVLCNIYNRFSGFCFINRSASPRKRTRSSFDQTCPHLRALFMG